MNFTLKDAERGKVKKSREPKPRQVNVNEMAIPFANRDFTDFLEEKNESKR